MSCRSRLDLLVANRFSLSRSYSAEIIEKGLVSVCGKIINKPGKLVDEASDISLIQDAKPHYVSRGGYKLEKALDTFPLDPKNRVCVDAGASTGGFTHCLLQAGAKKVYAIDSGSGQLSPVLKNDPRVISMEKTNLRTMDIASLQEVSLAVADLSFISLAKALPPVIEALLPDGELICLIKPQFEAGRRALNKKGVVKDKRVHERVIKDVISFIMNSGLIPLGLTFSPIQGSEGNMEYLLYAKKPKDFNTGVEEIDFDMLTRNVVNKAHLHFTGGEK